MNALRHAVTLHGRRLWRRQRGQSAVELALVLPLLMILLTGVWTFGLAINNYVLLEEATGAGSRKLALSRGQGGDACAIAATTIAAAAPPLSNSGSTANGLGFTIVVGGQTFASATPQCPNATWTAGQPVQVTATYPCTLKLFRVAAVSNCFLQVASTEIIQ